VVLRVASILVFTLGWIPIFRYRSEHMATKLAAASPGERRWIPLTTAVVAVHVTIAETVLTLPLVGIGAPATDPTLRLPLGDAVFAAGLLWWFWARRTLGPLDRFVDTVQPPIRLLVTGPFGVVRHPLALGTLLCALGPAIAAGTLVTWLGFAACAFCLAKRCVQDEEVLWDVFGDAYRRYAARTRRLVPFVW
jgi:protein-S-isoprenylcysteine O-methyltransferase Ste14